MSDALQLRLQQLRASVSEMPPPEVARRLQQGGLLIDIREEDEVGAGMPAPALRIARGLLDLQIAQHAATLDTPL